LAAPDQQSLGGDLALLSRDGNNGSRCSKVCAEGLRTAVRHTPLDMVVTAHLLDGPD
jgi:hypothetical protein